MSNIPSITVHYVNAGAARAVRVFVVDHWGSHEIIVATPKLALDYIEGLSAYYPVRMELKGERE